MIRKSGALLLTLVVAAGGCSNEGGGSGSTSAPSTAVPSGATVRHTAMSNPRSEHTATRTAYGVVVVGGMAGGTVTDSVEIYSNGAWASGGKLIAPRKGHTATLLPSGKVLIAGGQKDAQGTQLLGTIELYDPATKTSVAVGSMTKPRSGHYAVAFRAANLDFVLLGGGASVSGSDTTAELYDVTNRRIIPLAARMIQDRVGAQAMLLPSGKILIQGGLGGLTAGGLNMKVGGAELFDPATQTFARAGLMGIDRFNAAMALVDTGEAVVLGGNSQARSEDTGEVFSPASGTWSNMQAKLTAARDDLTATATARGSVVVAGGHTGSAFSATVELYTPRPTAAAGSIVALAPLQVARRGHTATLLTNGNVLLVGGVGVAGVLSSAEEYDAFALPGTPSAPAPAGPTVPVNPTNPGQTVAQPQILALYPSKGKPGDIITIAGKNFAKQRQDNQVIFGGNVYGRVLFEVKVKNLPFLGPVETLIVEVPAGAQTGNLVVVSNGSASHGRHFTIDMQSGGTPKVLYTLPRRQEPGKIVTIFGRNFARDAQANQVSFSGVPAQLIGGITTQSLPFLGSVSVMLVRVPSNAVTGDLVVTAYGKTSPGYAFEVEGTTPNTGSTNPGSTGTNTGGTAGQTVLFSEDFEGTSVNMSQSGGVWTVTQPGASGPASAPSGTWFAGTPAYGANARGYLYTPEIDLTGVTKAELSLKQLFATDGMDGGRVLVTPDNGVTYYLLNPVGGYLSAPVFTQGDGFAGDSGGWLSTSFDLSGFAGQRVTIVFDFASDSVDQRSGWFLDDVVVTSSN